MMFGTRVFSGSPDKPHPRHLAEFGADIAQKQSTSRAQSNRSFVAGRVGSIRDDQTELIHDFKDFGPEQFLEVGHRNRFAFEKEPHQGVERAGENLGGLGILLDRAEVGEAGDAQAAGNRALRIACLLQECVGRKLRTLPNSAAFRGRYAHVA
jgi:hypothetical protein